MKKILFIPDCHHPYADMRSWKLLLKVIDHWNPSTIVVLGDFADFYSVSAHDKDPNRVHCLAKEIDTVNARLDDLDKFQTPECVYICGNHENRLERYLMTKAPELFNVVSIAELLQLKDRGWKYVPYKAHHRIGKLYVTHDCGHSGGNSTRQSQRAFQSNTIIGHNHRMDYHVTGNLKGHPHVAASFGWLGDPKKANYMHQVKSHCDWAQGFGLGYLEKNGNVHLVPVPIVQGKVVVNGNLISL